MFRGSQGGSAGRKLKVFIELADTMRIQKSYPSNKPRFQATAPASIAGFADAKVCGMLCMHAENRRNERRHLFAKSGRGNCSLDNRLEHFFLVGCKPCAPRRGRRTGCLIFLWPALGRAATFPEAQQCAHPRTYEFRRRPACVTSPSSATAEKHLYHLAANLNQSLTRSILRLILKFPSTISFSGCPELTLS